MSDTRFVKGAAKLKARIATIRATFALPILTDEIGKMLLRRKQKDFDAAVDPSGRPWKKLAPITVKDKLRKGFGGQGILKRTQRLRNSLKLIKGSATGAIYTNTGAGVRIGIDDPEVIPYARAHNLGYSKGNLPMRKFLGVSRLDVKATDGLLRRKAVKLGLTE